MEGWEGDEKGEGGRGKVVFVESDMIPEKAWVGGRMHLLLGVRIYPFFCFILLVLSFQF